MPPMPPSRKRPKRKAGINPTANMAGRRRTPQKRSPSVTIGPKRTPPRPKPTTTTPSTATPGGPATPVTLPADPMATLTPAQMVEAARQQAMAQLQPQLDLINQDQGRADAAHGTRVQQLTDWGNWQGGRLDKAFSDTTSALNKLISLQGGVDQTSKDTLASALRAATGDTAQQAQASGNLPVETNQQGVLSSAADAAKSAQLGLGGGAGAALGAMGESRGLAGIGLQQNQEQERQRYNAIVKDISGKRTDTTNQLSGLIATSLKDQRDFQLAKSQLGEQKANRLFQQYLSEQELGLKKKDQSFQQWLATQQIGETKRSNRAQEGLAREQFLSQRAIDWANVGINKTQAEAQLAQIAADAENAKNGDAKEKAKMRGEGMSKAIEWLSGYMVPGKDEATHSTSGAYPYNPGGDITDPNTGDVKSLAPYKRTFDDAVRGMMLFTSKSDALRILSHSEYTDWRSKARAMLTRLKRRGTTKEPPAKPVKQQQFKPPLVKPIIQFPPKR